MVIRVSLIHSHYYHTPKQTLFVCVCVCVVGEGVGGEYTVFTLSIRMSVCSYIRYVLVSEQGRLPDKDCLLTFLFFIRKLNCFTLEV